MTDKERKDADDGDGTKVADPYALPAVEADDDDIGGPRRRGDTRLPLEVQVEIYAPDCSVCGTTRDISLSGLFVETNAEIPLETDCEVALTMAGEPRIVHKARVARLVSPDSGNRGLGLFFQELETD